MLAEAPRSEPESEGRPGALYTTFLVAAEAPIAAAMTTEPARMQSKIPGAEVKAFTRSLAPALLRIRSENFAQQKLTTKS